MRRASQRDRNHSEIVSWYRRAFISVLDLSLVGGGCPDLVVGCNGHNDFVEIKDGSKKPSARKLRRGQVGWHEQWRGSKPRIIETERDVINHIVELRKRPVP